MGQSAGWSEAEWCAAIGITMIVVGFGFGGFLLATTGKRRRMTQEELTQSILRDDITDMPTYSVSGPGVGVKVEISATTDTLREAKARGDWAVFWSWPLFTVGCFGGTQLVLTAVGLSGGGILWLVPVLGGLIFVPAALVWAYRPFAVLLEKNPADEEIPSSETPEEMQRRW